MPRVMIVDDLDNSRMPVQEFVAKPVSAPALPAKVPGLLEYGESVFR